MTSPNVRPLAKLNPVDHQRGKNANPHIKVAVNQVGVPIMVVGMS